MTSSGRDSGRLLSALTNKERAAIVRNMAGLLLSREQDIVEANRLDIKNAQASGTGTDTKSVEWPGEV